MLSAHAARLPGVPLSTTWRSLQGAPISALRATLLAAVAACMSLGALQETRPPTKRKLAARLEGLVACMAEKDARIAFTERVLVHSHGSR